jgi:hypothetical protein
MAKRTSRLHKRTSKRAKQNVTGRELYDFGLQLTDPNHLKLLRFTETLSKSLKLSKGAREIAGGATAILGALGYLKMFNALFPNQPTQ